MANQEDYLDSLLNSVMDDEESLDDSFDSELYETQEGLGDDIDMDDDDDIDGFLRDFEAHLNDDEEFDVDALELSDEEEILVEENSRFEEKGSDSGDGDDDFLGDLSDILNGDDDGGESVIEENPEEIESKEQSGEESGADIPAGSVEEPPADGVQEAVSEEADDINEPEAQPEADIETEAPADIAAAETAAESEAGGADTRESSEGGDMPDIEEISGGENMELGEILQEVAGDDISEINQILNADENDIPVMPVEGIDPAAVAVASGKKEKDPNAPRGIKGKVLNALFEDLEIPTGEGPTKEEIAAMEAEKAAQKQAEKEEKKRLKEEKKAQKQAQKEEKKKLAEEKKAQKAAEKAAKKAAKPKKEKKPKEKRPPIKKKPIILTLVFAASIAILVYLLSSSGHYSIQMEEAQSYYSAGSYIEAYDSLAGISVRSGDSDFYQQTKLLGGLQQSYNDYLMRLSDGDITGAIDSLVRGVGRYNLNQEEAGSLGILDKYQAIESQIEEALSTYGIDAARALELYDIEDRKEYTRAIQAYAG